MGNIQIWIRPFHLTLSLLFLILRVSAQDYPLFVQGAFEDATTTDDTYNSGGLVFGNGFNMSVPKNVLVQFPAALVPFPEFVARKQDFVGYETLVCPSIVPPFAPMSRIYSNTGQTLCRDIPGNNMLLNLQR